MVHSTELTIDDHKDFLRMLGGRKASLSILLISIGVLVMTLFALYAASRFVVALFGPWQIDDSTVLWEMPGLLLAVVTGVLLLPVVLLLFRWSLRFFLRAVRFLKVGAIDERFLREGFNVGAVQFEPVADGFRIAMALQENVYRWSAFGEVRETDQNLFLMLDAKSGVIVPKRAFADDRAVQEFKSLVERGVRA